MSAYVKGASGKVEGTCKRCGLPWRSKAQNNTLCAACAYLRDLTYILQHDNRNRECAVCGTTYRPARRTDSLCGACTVDGFPGPCVFCERDVDNLVNPVVAVCWPCFKAPGNRPRLLRALGDGRAWRIANPAEALARAEERYGVTLPAIAAPQPVAVVVPAPVPEPVPDAPMEVNLELHNPRMVNVKLRGERYYLNLDNARRYARGEFARMTHPRYKTPEAIAAFAAFVDTLPPEVEAA